MKSRIKKGDVVKVIRGNKDDKGKTGKVLEVIRSGQSWRVRVEGLNMEKKHVKPQRSAKNPEGGIVEGAGSIPIAHVMLMSDKLGRPVRTGAVFTSDGKKERVARGRKVKAEKV